MKYQSTRGKVSQLTFKQAVMMGLASDGGLLLPESIPDVSQCLPEFKNLTYAQLAYEVMSLYITDIEESELKAIINKSYATFSHPDIVPLRTIGDINILELFHGPTLAFKDVALQFLGNVFEHILKESGSRVNILGATSGDTGSAAIAGVRGKDNIDVYIMFPEGKTSPLQELQMTSVLDANVHNIGINGSFDDCQSLLKTIFSDLEFKDSYQLAAVNSVNWARVLAQVVYYFSAYNQLGQPKKSDVCVPTGNFGNVLAGYIAKQMGLPIARLIIATNSNDILARFFRTGIYERGDVNFTHSPAMDIQVASNFERYLFYKLDQNAEKLTEFMKKFSETGRAELRFNSERFDRDFVAASVSNEETIQTVKKYYETFNYLVDPHTAVGISVAEKVIDADVPLVCLSTAHPAKFNDVMAQALPGVEVTHPSLEVLKGRETRKIVMDADIEAIKSLIKETQ